MRKSLVGLVAVPLLAAWLGGCAAQHSAPSTISMAPATAEALSADPAPVSATAFPATGERTQYGYARVYKTRTLDDIDKILRSSDQMKTESRVSCEIYIDQIREAHPDLNLPFESCEGAALAISTDPNFRVEKCQDAMFSNGALTSTNSSGTSYGISPRKSCYEGEVMLAYKGQVLGSLTCLNVWRPATVSQTFASLPAPAGPCSNGYTLAFMAWDLPMLPQSLQDKTAAFTAEARKRDTHQATDPRGYEGDDFSRSLGYRLRHEVGTPYPVNTELEVNYRDPRTAQIVQRLGTMQVYAGEGEMVLPGDPRNYIVEIVLPDSFVTQAMSGGKRRIWDLPDEWNSPLVQQYCRQYTHGGGFFSHPIS